MRSNLVKEIYLYIARNYCNKNYKLLPLLLLKETHKTSV